MISSTAPKATEVAVAIGSFRDRIPEHTRDYTVALLALAKANAKAAKEGKSNPRKSSAAQAELGKKGGKKANKKS